MAISIVQKGFRPAALLAVIAVTVAACGGGSDGGTVAEEPSPPPVPVARADMLDASRFAANASFGLGYGQIETLARQGKDAWLTNQFNQSPGSHQEIVTSLLARREAGEFEAFEDDIELLIQFRRFAWWHQTVTGDDTLRQRIAFALSQILVVSDKVDALIIDPYAISNYYDMLLGNAFGNYREIMRDVALHPSMGIYLSHVNNRKADPVQNTFPDENFAREFMQLFSIGLFELNIDGTVVLDAQAQPVPTYDNSDIREFAKIFTGLSYGGRGAYFGRRAPNFLEQMTMFEQQHEPGEKQLLNDLVVPAGQAGLQDIDAAIDNLFNHPNVGPFIGRLLIQRLVTSNPSPAYVERVARAFNGDAGGVRGDMKNVIRAILMDEEANQLPDFASSFGKLREPVLRYTSILRQFGAESADGNIFNSGFFLEYLSRQHPLSSPSVFNFYLPAHMPAGELADAALVAPEFEITNSTTIIGLSNLIDAVVVSDYVTDVEAPFERARLNLDEFVAIAENIDELLDRLDILLTYGTLDSLVRAEIHRTIEQMPDLEFRVRLAMYLILVSPDYAVQI